MLHRWLVPVGLLACVLFVDALLLRLDPGFVLLGVLDWSAHLATAALVLLALGVPWRAWLVVLPSSVLLDLDHLALGVPGVEAAGGRPFTHSALTVLVLLGVSLRWRPLLLVTAGVLLHFLRDVATGPGLPLLWPAGGAVLLPYLLYVSVCAGLAAVAVSRTTARAGKQEGDAPVVS